MTEVSTNEFRPGLKIIIDKELCEIIENDFHKPGKGQAVMRVKYKCLLNGRVLDKTFKTGESVEKADISSIEMQYLYKEGNNAIFMKNNDPKRPPKGFQNRHKIDLGATLGAKMGPGCSKRASETQFGRLLIDVGSF